jgi:hypothetical protein
MSDVNVRREVDTKTHQEKKACEDGGRDCSFVVPSQGILGPSEAGRGKEGFFPRDSKGSIVLLTP